MNDLNIDIPLSITTGYTHCGVFHADETMATAMLRILYPDMKVIRTVSVPKSTQDNEIVYDIGNGRYDHHLDKKFRKNGVPYAACGLIWRDFGPAILRKLDIPEEAMGRIDCAICQPIDLRDNEGSQRPVDIPMMEFSDCISAMNPTWEEGTECAEEAFNEAVELCEKVLRRQLGRAKSVCKAKDFVETAIEKSNKVVQLESFVPWHSHLLNSENPKANDILFVTYPSLRGGYSAQAVPIKGSNEKRMLFPAEWCGKERDELAQLTGVADAMFCHKAGFLASAKSLAGITAIVQKAIAING